MAHDELDFFQRAAAQEIVVQSDAHGVAKSTDVGAHASALPGSIDFIELINSNAIRVSHA